MKKKNVSNKDRLIDILQNEIKELKAKNDFLKDRLKEEKYAVEKLKEDHLRIDAVYSEMYDMLSSLKKHRDLLNKAKDEAFEFRKNIRRK